jgi:integrase
VIDGARTEEQAQLALKAVEVELATGVQVISGAHHARGIPTVQAFSDDYRRWYRTTYSAGSAERLDTILGSFLPRFGRTAMNMVSPRDVERWKMERHGAGKSAGTVAKEVKTIKAMFRRAVEWEVIDAHPFPHTKAPAGLVSKAPRWYTKPELKRLYDAAGDRRWLWQFIVNTGIRRGEALKARRIHVQPKRGKQPPTILIESEGKRGRTKSGEWRPVPLNDSALEALAHLGDDYLLVPRYAFPNQWSRAFREDRDGAKLDGGIHCLRHTFCSHLVMEGIPLRTVQLLAGHSSITVTEQYAHLAPGFLRDATSSIAL